MVSLLIVLMLALAVVVKNLILLTLEVITVLLDSEIVLKTHLNIALHQDKALILMVSSLVIYLYVCFLDISNG